MQLETGVWLVLMVLFLLVELAGVGLVSLWFAAGALVAMLLSICGVGVAVQVVAFVVVSAVLLAVLRPLARRYFTPKITPTNVDSVVGSVGILSEAVDNVTAQGRVKLGGMSWTARSTDGAPIPAGTRVRVDRVEGVKVLVSPEKEEATVH